ncbi:hypothetical protein LIER_42990 [Lithospermum erythrorhizon]|uniref:Uncharacterized protein n=1 Tax=Lithospermum erythrorhizon TaxID=34254 RepID=A0AAV3P962_LITER
MQSVNFSSHNGLQVWCWLKSSTGHGGCAQTLQVLTRNLPKISTPYLSWRGFWTVEQVTGSLISWMSRGDTIKLRCILRMKKQLPSSLNMNRIGGR